MHTFALVLSGVLREAVGAERIPEEIAAQGMAIADAAPDPSRVSVLYKSKVTSRPPYTDSYRHILEMTDVGYIVYCLQKYAEAGTLFSAGRQPSGGARDRSNVAGKATGIAFR